MKKVMTVLLIVMAAMSYVSLLPAAPLESTADANNTIVNSSTLLEAIDDSLVGNQDGERQATDTVPEPATLLLFGAGMIGLVSTHRSRVKSRR